MPFLRLRRIVANIQTVMPEFPNIVYSIVLTANYMACACMKVVNSSIDPAPYIGAK
jgi:hypothetical protein